MDIETIDRNYQQLQEQGQQTVRTLSALAAKLQRAAEAGDLDAREWLLDLKEVALEVRTEQAQVGQLLESLHGFVANHLDDRAPQDRASYERAPYDQGQQAGYPQQQPYAQPAYQQPYAQQGYPQQGGGTFGRFMGSTFGQAVTMGAGFAIGEDLIDDIFG